MTMKVKLKEILDKTNRFFQEKGFDSPRLDAELLLAFALHLRRIDLYLKFEQPLSEEELTACRDVVRRRAQGEPVAYIIGEKGFFTSVFKVGEGVLIPRPESEHLVEEGLVWMKKNPQPNFLILDLGCGSGCIGLSLLKAQPQAQLIALDISQKALEFSRKNAEALGILERCHFILGDAQDVQIVQEVMQALNQERIHLILSNPPYLDKDDPAIEKNVRAYEPAEALFADDKGLAKLRLWSQKYLALLAQPGLMLMEMGYQQGPAMKDFYQTLEFDSVAVKKDLAGHDRLIVGENI